MILFRWQLELAKKRGYTNDKEFNGTLRFGLQFSPTLNPGSWGNWIAHQISSDAVGQVIGGASVTVDIQGGKIDFTINNATSRNSLYLHIGDNVPRPADSTKVLSTIYQHIHFSGELEYE